MNGKIVTFVLAVSLIFSVYSGKSGDSGTGDRKEAGIPEGVKTASASRLLSESDYKEIYDPILNDFYKFISGSSEGESLNEGATGVREVVLGLTRNEALQTVGYALQDISGDGSPELLIGKVQPTDKAGNDIYAVYTCRDGKPLGVFEGWARSNYQYMGKSRFFYRGSGGVMHSIFGTYTLVRDGSSLSCNDYYFTWEKDQSMSELGFYHNRSGHSDTKVSEELKITKEKFWKISDDFERQTQKISLIPFARYAKTAVENAADSEHQVRVQWAKDGLAGYASYESFAASSAEHAVKVLFSSPGGVRDFRVLALTLIEQNGKMTFSAKELYHLKDLVPERPLVVTMTFWGSIPNNGVSYVDASGRTRRFAVVESGKDGSLGLDEF